MLTLAKKQSHVQIMYGWCSAAMSHIVYPFFFNSSNNIHWCFHYNLFSKQFLFYFLLMLFLLYGQSKRKLIAFRIYNGNICRFSSFLGEKRLFIGRNGFRYRHARHGNDCRCYGRRFTDFFRNLSV